MLSAERFGPPYYLLETSNLASESRYRKESTIGGVFSGDLIEWSELVTLRGGFRKQ